MKIIQSGRRTGKTTKIIKMVIKEDGYLLTFNEKEVEILKKIEPKLEGKVFTWKHLPECLMGKEKKKVFIDNAEYFIAEFIQNNELGGLTFNL
jgi:hypothetical protein